MVDLKETIVKNYDKTMVEKKKEGKYYAIGVDHEHRGGKPIMLVVFC